MGVASERLQIVRERPDGSLMWQEPLVAPGGVGSQSAVLADPDVATVLGATQFQVTESGEWLAVVRGMTYFVLPAVIPNTGQWCFIGVPVRGFPLGNPRDVRPRHLGGNGRLTVQVEAHRPEVEPPLVPPPPYRRPRNLPKNASGSSSPARRDGGSGPIATTRRASDIARKNRPRSPTPRR
jgi:hypothetical protein